MPFSMKAITLLLAVACAVSFSSCCCQSQPMPKLRPMPKFQPVDDTTPQQPIKVFRDKNKLK